MTIYIYDRAFGILQYDSTAKTPAQAWAEFSSHLGYSGDEQEVHAREAYCWTTSLDVHDILECEDFPIIGRPPELSEGRRVNVYLDGPSLKRAADLGNGNVSAGIRNALTAPAKKTD